MEFQKKSHGTRERVLRRDYDRFKYSLHRQVDIGYTRDPGNPIFEPRL